MQGFTLHKAIVDLNFDSNTDSTTGYVALSRAKRADDMLIMQPFNIGVFRKGPRMQPHFLYSYVRGDNIIEEINGWVEQSKNKHKEHVSSVRAVAGKRGGDTTGRPGGPGERTKSVQSPPDIGSTASSKRPGVSKCNSQNPEMQSRKAKEPRPNAKNPYQYVTDTCMKHEKKDFSKQMIKNRMMMSNRGDLRCKTCEAQWKRTST